MAVTFECGLKEVTHKPLLRDVSPVVDALKDLGDRLDIEFLFIDPSTFVDEENNEGVAFAIGKSDRNFFEKVGRHEFRYRSDLIEDGLRAIVEQHDLKDEVLWDRGMGVFVYNLYYKDRIA